MRYKCFTSLLLGQGDKDTRVALVFFGNHIDKYPYKDMTNAKKFAETLQNRKRRKGKTYTNKAIDAAKEFLQHCNKCARFSINVLQIMSSEISALKRGFMTSLSCQLFR